MSTNSEIVEIAVAVEAVKGQTDEAAVQTRLEAGQRLVEISRGRLLESVAILAQLPDNGVLSRETLEWLFDRCHEEGHRNDTDDFCLN